MQNHQVLKHVQNPVQNTGYGTDFRTESGTESVIESCRKLQALQWFGTF